MFATGSRRYCCSSAIGSPAARNVQALGRDSNRYHRRDSGCLLRMRVAGWFH
jgi:hypothetical protein